VQLFTNPPKGGSAFAGGDGRISALPSETFMRMHPVLAATLLAAACLPVAAQQLKPGLWEINNKMGGNPQMDQQMAEMQKQLAAMPPEQRKQMEAMMAQQGVKMAPAGGKGGMTIQSCMTKEMSERKDVPMQDGCKVTRQQGSGKTMKMAFACTNPPSSGEGEFNFVSDQAYTSKMTVKSMVDGKQQTTTMDAAGKWLAAGQGGHRARQLERLLGRHAGLGRPAVDVDLQAHLQRRQFGRPLLRQALRDLQPVDRVRPMEMRRHQPRLVALDRAYAMPLQRQAGQQRHLLHRFLDVVLAEGILARGLRRAHGFRGHGLGHGKQRDFVHVPSRGCAGCCYPFSHALEVAGNRRHNGPGHPWRTQRPAEAMIKRDLWILPSCCHSASRTKLRTFTCRPACRR
jgi:hypothetical protein